MVLFDHTVLISGVTRSAQSKMAVYFAARAQVLSLAAIVMFSRAPARQDVYNLLWAVVFGFATLNILSLAARRFEPGRRGLSFGELLAVMVVLIALSLLGWEMLNLFHVFPIKLHR
jgi:hypothetical protein